jgi:hypothetical protein
MRSNEFNGASLGEAVRNATAAYGARGLHCELKNQKRCNDLILEMNNLSREATRYSDRAGQLEREAESLKQEAIVDFGFAAVAALSGAAAALLRLKRILRVIGRFRQGKVSHDDLAELLNLIGPLASAIAALRAFSKLAEVQRLVREAEDLLDHSERLGNQYTAAVDEYVRYGCGESRNFTGI